MCAKRIIFMGTPEFACPALQTLIERPEELVAVFTQPDRPKGRGQKMQYTPVKELALANHIPVYQPTKIREDESISLIRTLAPDVIIVVAFGQILPKSLLDIPPFGCINVHASLLPRYRGAAPLNWCLVNGEAETGVTTMLMDVGLDTGDMLLKEATAIDMNEDISSLHDRLSVMGARLLGQTLDLLWEGKLHRETQDDSASCYASMLKKEHGIIDWNRSALEIHNQVRGLSSWPGACTTLNGIQLKLYETRVGNGTGIPGEIIKADKAGLEIACGNASLLVGSLQLAGKKRLDVRSFIAGYPISVGTLLSSEPVAGEKQ